ncbi:MAG: UTP--glucose-1-phosphate uridylyltransferase [Anaerolineaceae bacterium]|nr:UTP--glucose-1-phosphate uridylyltransferase [Anaerolineaceae bacterium]
MKNAVIPVAGLGTRLLPATKSQPKEMLPVGRKPIVQYIVEELIRGGINEILFITGPDKASLENHFDTNHELVQTLREKGKEDLLAELDFDRLHAQYYYTRQRETLGLGHAVMCARSFVGKEPFIVALGDSIIGLNATSNIVQRMEHCFDENDCAAVIAFEEVPDHEVSQYGIAKPKTDGDVFELLDIIEKPEQAESPSNLAVAARYIFTPTIFDALNRTTPGKGGEIQLTDAIKIMIEDGAKVCGVRLNRDERRYDIGNFESYFRAFIEFALADEKFGDSLREYIATLSGN